MSDPVYPKTERLRCNVAGHPENDLFFDAWSQCGSIDDGVAFTNGRRGGWVISFRDLERFYQSAKHCRESFARNFPGRKAGQP